MIRVQNVMDALESKAPLSYQENYDNAGLSVGDSKAKVTGILVALDCTEEVIKEAIKLKSNLVITHHPLIFQPIQKLTGQNLVEKCIRLAIKNDINIYSSHTNLDSVQDGVNAKIGEKLGLMDLKILRANQGGLKKLITFCPEKQAEKVRLALFESGAGNIGNYDHCSFNAGGTGTFRASSNSNPYVGKKGEDHTENEVRIEVIYRNHLESKIISALLKAHPYEEVAYDIYPLENRDESTGMGMVGILKKEITPQVFLKQLQKNFDTGSIKYTPPIGKQVKKVAICGGSGSFLLSDAIAAQADVFVTADIKYHQFFDAHDKIMLIDIGHYESEQFTTELLVEYLKEIFTSFATHFSRVNTNPIKYF